MSCLNLLTSWTMKSTWKISKSVKHWQLSRNVSMLSKMSLTGSKRLQMSGTKRKLSLSTRTTHTVSFKSYLESAATGVSKQSFSKRVADAGKAETKPDWDNGSATSETR